MDSYNSEKTAEPWLKRKLFYEHLAKTEGENFTILADPLFDFALSRELNSGDNMYVNTRAVQLYASLYDKITITSSFYETQADLPQYIDSYYNTFHVVPGEARVKPFGNGAYDWGTAYATLGYQATSWLYVETGNDKNFIGNGYRSMILSDYSPQYLYLKTSLHHGRFFYTNLAARTLNPNFNNISGSNSGWSENSLYEHKMMNINYFGVHVNNKIQAGIFEASMLGVHTRNAPKFTAFLPVINELAYANDSLHFLWGADILICPSSYLPLGIYSQIVYDSRKAIAIQAGLSWTIFTSMGSWFLRGEWNMASSGTYQSLNDDNFWGHYNQPLSHPAGNNFNEWLVQLGWQYKRLQAFAHIGQTYYKSGISSRNIYNNNLNDAEVPVRLFTADFTMSFLVNPSYNWHIFMGISYWNQPVSSEKYLIPSLGMKTFLRNRYFDF